MTRCRSRRHPGGGKVRRALPRAARASVAACSVAVACGLAGCANHDGTDLARQACRYVGSSLALYQSSLHAASPAVASAEQSQAVAQLSQALPLAATAAGEAGQFQALMSTLAESDHLPESYLVHALRAQCAAADSSGDLIPTPAPTAETPSTRPPPTGL